jgi:hypothetical protein
MAFTTRATPDAMIFALVAAWNHRQEAAVASSFHADITQVTTGDYRAPVVANDTPALSIGGNPTDSTTVISFTNALKKLINRHFADTRAHNSAVSSAVATADGTDITTACTLATALKAAYGTHLAASNVHFNNDGTNTIAAADATNSTTAITLLTEMRTDVGAHIIGATAGAMINLVDP